MIIDTNLNTTVNSVTQTIVVAGSYSEYLNWRKENPSIKFCKYVDKTDDIKGIQGFLADIILYGNYQQNPLYNTRQMQRLLAEWSSPFRSYLKDWN